MKNIETRIAEELETIDVDGRYDWIDSENFVEINGDYYDADECERIKDETLSEIESKIEAVEEEIS